MTAPIVRAVALPAGTATGEGAAEPDTSDRRSSAGEAGLEALYRSESPWLVHSLTRRTGDAEEARDLAQDAFQRFVRIHGESAFLERPRAYLRRIAANLLKDRARSRARRSADHHVAVDEERIAAGDPHALLESRDMLNRLEKAMMRLRPRTREIFMAHRVHGLTYAEIAERDGLSVKAVEKQMGKALAQLDRILGGR